MIVLISLMIKEQIIKGTLKEDDPLPSIRSLAKDLRISVITTKRAYDELEKEGLIYTAPGKGCFIAARNTEMLREENLRKLEEHIAQVAALSRMCGLSLNDITEMLKFEMED